MSFTIFSFGFRFTDTFRLASPPVLVVFSGNGGQHIQQHAVDGLQHAAGEIIADDAGQSQMTGWQVQTDDGQLLIGDLLSQYFPPRVVQTGESVYLLN